MIRPFNGKTPKIAESAFISEAAYVVGDVEIGENSGVWPGAVIRGDFGSIKIGKESHVQDNSVLHTDANLQIGDNVLIGHSAVVHCLKVGHNVLIGNNATILDHAEIGDGCIIGANSMVASGQKIPEHSFVVGVPAKVKRELSTAMLDDMRHRMAERRFQAGVKDFPAPSYSDMAKKYKEEGL